MPTWERLQNKRIRRHGETKVWAALKEGCKRDPCLHASERCAQTVVDTVTETQVPVGRPCNIEDFRLLENRGVVVRRKFQPVKPSDNTLIPLRKCGMSASETPTSSLITVTGIGRA